MTAMLRIRHSLTANTQKNRYAIYLIFMLYYIPDLFFIQESESSVLTLTSRVQSLESDLSDLRHVKSELKSEVSSLRELLQKSETQSSVLESTVYKLRKEINEYTDKVCVKLAIIHVAVFKRK